MFSIVRVFLIQLCFEQYLFFNSTDGVLAGSGVATQVDLFVAHDRCTSKRIVVLSCCVSRFIAPLGVRASAVHVTDVTVVAPNVQLRRCLRFSRVHTRFATSLRSSPAPYPHLTSPRLTCFQFHLFARVSLVVIDS